MENLILEMELNGYKLVRISENELIFTNLTDKS